MPTTKIGGRLADFLPAWRTITANKTVLSYISGAKILFTKRPTSALSSFAQPRFSEHEASQVDEFVLKLKQAQVISVVSPSPDQIISPIFLTTNHDGSLRLIFNMKKINKECISTTHFKLETLQQILPLIPRGAWFTSWDLVQGFYNVLVHVSQRHFFCFDWRGTRYQFRALPMGCSESPRIFSKVVRAVIYRARALGINVFSYLDDTLTFDLSYARAKSKSTQFADLLTYVGFLLHKDKSVREPTQRIVFLGFIVDSNTMRLEVPHDKFLAIQALVQTALDVVDGQTKTSLRFLARVVGKLISVCSNAEKNFLFPSKKVPFHDKIEKFFSCYLQRVMEKRTTAPLNMCGTENWRSTATTSTQKLPGPVRAVLISSGGLHSRTRFRLPLNRRSSPST